MEQRRHDMNTRTDSPDAADAILPAWESDAGFDAWTLDELDDELGSLRPALAGSDDAGG
jgi:hypothetical protein